MDKAVPHPIRLLVRALAPGVRPQRNPYVLSGVLHARMPSCGRFPLLVALLALASLGAPSASAWTIVHNCHAEPVDPNPADVCREVGEAIGLVLDVYYHHDEYGFGVVVEYGAMGYGGTIGTSVCYDGADVWISQSGCETKPESDDPYGLGTFLSNTNQAIDLSEIPPRVHLLS